MAKKGCIDMKIFLIIVDMQKDFVDGALGSKEAVAIVGNVVKKIESFDGAGIRGFDPHHPPCFNF